VCPFPIPQNCTVDEFKATVIRHIALRSGGNEHMEVAVLGTFEQFIRALRVNIIYIYVNYLLCKGLHVFVLCPVNANVFYTTSVF
jgi:hypothetical protein